MEKIKLISHRGNLNGKDSSIENLPSQIDYCIKHGFDVEIDIRYINNNYYLGHDEPQYKVSFDWIYKRKKFLWVHCKDIESLYILSKHKEINSFWHQSDSFVLTTKNFIWTYPGMPLTDRSICVLLEQHRDKKIINCYGICTDYISDYKEIMNE